MDKTKLDTGGSAFPETDSDVSGRNEEAVVEVYSYGGMTLLDHFADGYVPSEAEIQHEIEVESQKARTKDTYIRCSIPAIRARIRYKEGMAMIAEKRRLEIK